MIVRPVVSNSEFMKRVIGNKNKRKSCINMV